jgi:hypothetical protein
MVYQMLYEIRLLILVENDDHLYFFVVNEFYQIFENDHRRDVDRSVLLNQLRLETL